MKKRYQTIIIYLLIFISLLIFSYFFPYSGDDYSWSTLYGINELKNFFQDLNGRYLGNLLIIIISRNNIIKTIFMSSVIFGILYFSSKILKKDNRLTIIILYIFFLFAHRRILSQGIFWSSGFCNYATSTLLVLMILYFIIYHKEFKYSFLVYFMLGFIGCFWVENVTIAIFLLASIINIYYFIKNKKINKNYCFLLLGSFLGSILMFINPSYLRLFNNTDTYRQIQKDNLTRNMFPFIFKNYLLNLLKIFTLYLVSFKSKKIRNYVLSFLLVILIIFLFSFTTYNDHSYIFALIYLGLLILFFLFNYSLLEKENKTIILMLLLVFIPLFFVTPIGARNFLTVYFLECLIYLKLILKLKPKWNKKYNLIFIIGLIIIYSAIFNVYYQDFKKVKIATKALITKVNNGETYILVDRKLVTTNVVHWAFPQSQAKDDFCEFYKIDCNWIISYRKQ